MPAAGASAALPAAPIPPGLAEETGYLLRRGYVQAGKWAQAALPADVPASHYEVLHALSDLGPHSQHELGQILRVNRTVMVKLIDALEHQGLVERHRNPRDRRSYSLVLTPPGRRALTALAPDAARAEAGLTARLTDREQDRLRALLNRLAFDDERSVDRPATLAGRVGYLLTRAHFRVRDEVNERFGELGLTTALYGTLATIADAGPTSQQAIADQLGLTGPAIVQNVDRLEAAGLVERRRDPSDRRSYALEPTRHGHEMLARARDATDKVNHELEHTLGGRPPRHELNGLLRKLLETA